MFRMLKYFLIFFLGYYIIRKLFGVQQAEKKPDISVSPKPEFFSRETQNTNHKKEGEYIDYEEIK
jgi:hypothetical protein